MNYAAVRKEDTIGEVLKHKVSYLCYQINNGKQKLFMKKLEAAHGFGFFALLILERMKEILMNCRWKVYYISLNPKLHEGYRLTNVSILSHVLKIKMEV